MPGKYSDASISCKHRFQVLENLLENLLSEFSRKSSETIPRKPPKGGISEGMDLPMDNISPLLGNQGVSEVYLTSASPSEPDTKTDPFVGPLRPQPFFWYWHNGSAPNELTFGVTERGKLFGVGYQREFRPTFGQSVTNP